MVATMVTVGAATVDVTAGSVYSLEKQEQAEETAAAPGFRLSMQPSDVFGPPARLTKTVAVVLAVPVTVTVPVAVTKLPVEGFRTHLREDQGGRGRALTPWGLLWCGSSAELGRFRPTSCRMGSRARGCR